LSTLARTDFRAAAARRLSEERELSPAIVSLLSNDRQGRPRGGVRNVALERITPNPEQPRLALDETSLQELAASIREHGVLQPILVRPLDGGDYQLIAGERRWRASKAAGLDTIPALVEEIDDDTALEISIIENLQREDLSPLDEAAMYDRMVRDHGYSVRRLAQKLGKDKGYLENRLRLADAPEEIRELVSLRKDTLSHAYELLKVDDPKKRKRLAAQVARGELTLIKLRDRIEGRPARSAPVGPDLDDEAALEVVEESSDEAVDEAEAAWTGKRRDADVGELGDDALVTAKAQLAEAVETFMGILQAPNVVREISAIDRANLAKYLTIAKLRLENAIAVVRSESAIR
jgi:ParB family transcriptional regulator, chromosome partitioning protein